MTRKQKLSMRALALTVLFGIGLMRLAHAQQPAQSISAPAAGNGGQPTVYIDQKLNAQVPLDTQLRDENNQPVKIGDFLGKRPAILVFPFYKCAGSCLLEMDDLIHALTLVKFNPGKDFDVIVVSIDSNETYTMAQAKKREYLETYGRPGTEKGWHVLTGPEESVQKLTQSVGFHFTRDPQTNLISHPLGLMFLTSEGKMSHYLFGMTYGANDVKLALVSASNNKIGGISEYVSLLCSHYDSATGKYGVAIEKIVKVACAGTILILGGFIFAMFRLEKRRHLTKTDNPPAAPTGPAEPA